MVKQELTTAIEKIHDAIAQGQPLDESSREALRNILKEVEVALSRSEAEQHRHLPANLSLKERLVDMISDFELRHPQITSALSQITDRLSDMGI